MPKGLQDTKGANFIQTQFQEGKQLLPSMVLKAASLKEEVNPGVATIPTLPNGNNTLPGGGKFSYPCR